MRNPKLDFFRPCWFPSSAQLFWAFVTNIWFCYWSAEELSRFPTAQNLALVKSPPFLTHKNTHSHTQSGTMRFSFLWMYLRQNEHISRVVYRITWEFLYFWITSREKEAKRVVYGTATCRAKPTDPTVFFCWLRKSAAHLGDQPRKQSSFKAHRAMGVPKFFRWLSERYPLINQTVDLINVGPIIGTA